VEFDVKSLSPQDVYKLLVGIVVPRPIAWVTTVSLQGVVNAAPFSFFNVMGNDPPVVALGIGRDNQRPGGLKDTARNILANGEFVINLVTAELATQMVMTATEFPPEQDELIAAKLTTEASSKVAPPRIKASPINLECRHVSTIEIGRTRVTLGEVIQIHIANQYLDSSQKYVKTEDLNVLGRLHGAGWYVQTGIAAAQQQISRHSYEEWLAQQSAIES
jgi:flavin reductase (DIM6/NTAB) family NADH-FMN oxidoreductase RutF